MKIVSRKENMKVIEYVKREMADVRRMIEGTMGDMTDELFNYPSPGTANAISATFVHLLNAEDSFVQTIIQGNPSIWESEKWSEETGISKPPRISEDWSAFKHKKIAIQPLLDYKVRVWAGTDAYLASLTPEEFDREVNFAGGTRTVADMLLLLASHSLSHNGEIAALKGIQGAKGLPV
jgi:uncharacterized damage-inducible protein DinB